jgi:hypothetical protein
LKLKFLIFILLASFSITKAQRESKFTLKPALGITACQVHGDKYSGYNKLGFTGGLYLNALLKKKHSLEFGIIYIQKGARKNQNVEKFDYTYYLLRLNYIEVPLMYRWQHNKFFYMVGLSYGYLMSYYENSSELGNYTGLYPFLKSEYSFNIGLGMMIKPQIGVEVRTNNSYLTVRPWQSGFVQPYYNTLLWRTFNKGSYNNIMEVVLTYKLNPRKSREPKEEI